MIYHGTTPVREIVVHTSATRPDWARGKTVEEMRDEIREWHTSPPRNWRDIGYHAVIAPDGSIADGRPLDVVGAHVKGHNTGTLGVCLIPSRAEVTVISHFNDYYTPEQRQALQRWIADVMDKTDIQVISGHNQYTSLKLCPGFYVQQTPWLRPEMLKTVHNHFENQGGFWDNLWRLIAGLFR